MASTTTQLARRLGTNADGAHRFAKIVRKRVGYVALYRDILAAIEDSSDDQALASAVKAFIANPNSWGGPRSNSRKMSEELLEEYAENVWHDTGLAVSANDILRLWQILGEEASYETLLDHYQETAFMVELAKKWSIHHREVLEYSNGIKGRIGGSWSRKAILESLLQFDERPDSYRELLDQLEAGKIAKYLDISPAQAIGLRSEVQNKTGRRFDHRSIEQLLTSNGNNKMSVQEVRQILYFVEAEDIPVERILNGAKRLGFSLSQVVQLMSEVEDETGENVDLTSINKLVGVIGKKPMTVEEVREILILSHEEEIPAEELLIMARYLDATASQIIELKSQIEIETGNSIDHTVIKQLLKEAGRKNMTVQEVRQILFVAYEGDISVEDVLKLLDRVDRRTKLTVALEDLEKAFNILDRSNRTATAIAQFLELESIFGLANADTAQINQCVAALQSHRYPHEFRRTLKQMQKTTSLAVDDIMYLATVTDWPREARNMLFPDVGNEQQWYCTADADRIVPPKPRTLPWHRRLLGEQTTLQPQIDRLQHVASQCWQEIRSEKRRYQVPSDGRAEILTSRQLRDLLNLTSIGFVQEGAAAPSVFLQLSFGNGGVVGVAKISEKGEVEGLTQLFNSEWSIALMNATIVSYYRDLVLAVQWYEPKPQNSQQLTRRSSDGVKKQSKRSIPRRPDQRSTRQYHLEDWYEAQEMVRRHYVTGHRRWVSDHFIADSIKQRQAMVAGVTLPRGYTWVIEHERGNPIGRLPVPLDGEDLVRHTIFAPPRRASARLAESLEM